MLITQDLTAEYIKLFSAELKLLIGFQNLFKQCF